MVKRVKRRVRRVRPLGSLANTVVKTAGAVATIGIASNFANSFINK